MPRRMIGIGYGTLDTEIPNRPASPDIVSVSPASGAAAGGDTVRITVTHANPGSTVTIGGNSATVTASQIGAGGWYDVTTPAHAAGPVDVVVDDIYGTATLPNGFTYTGAALTAGTSAATGGDTVVFLSATAPTGGTSPYTYQWYRSTTDGQKGSSIAGATALTYTDTGRTNDTTYYYTLDATDNAGSPATVSYTQVSATPAAAAATNEPAGLTQLIYTDGSSKYYTTAVGAFTYGARWLDDTKVAVVADATNPTGSGYSIEKRFFVGDRDGWNGFANLNRYGAGWGSGLSEEYWRIRIFFSSNWECHTSGTQKLLYVGAEDYNNVQRCFHFDAHGANNVFNVRLIPMVGSPFDGVDGQAGDDLRANASANFGRGEWATIELWLKAQSAPGVADGECKIWVNGTLQNHWTGKQWFNSNILSTKWDGIQSILYWGGGTQVKTVDDYMRIGELKVSGKL